jgi:hypothetical protein
MRYRNTVPKRMDHGHTLGKMKKFQILPHCRI